MYGTPAGESARAIRATIVGRNRSAGGERDRARANLSQVGKALAFMGGRPRIGRGRARQAQTVRTGGVKIRRMVLMVGARTLIRFCVAPRSGRLRARLCAQGGVEADGPKGIGRHRLWDTKSNDTRFRDRF